MSDEILAAAIRETGESAYAVKIDVSGYSFTGDEPEAKSGKGLGPSPYDFLVAALGECTAMTVRWYARQKNWPLERVAVQMTYRKTDAANVPDAQGRTGLVDYFEKSITIEGAALTAEQKAKLIEIAAKCPVQRTLQNNPVIRTAVEG